MLMRAAPEARGEQQATGSAPDLASDDTTSLVGVPLVGVPIVGTSFAAVNPPARIFLRFLLDHRPLRGPSRGAADFNAAGPRLDASFSDQFGATDIVPSTAPRFAAAT